MNFDSIWNEPQIDMKSKLFRLEIKLEWFVRLVRGTKETGDREIGTSIKLEWLVQLKTFLFRIFFD